MNRKTPKYATSSIVSTVPCRPYTESWIREVLTPFAEHYKTLLAHPAVESDIILREAREELLALVQPFLRTEYQRRVRNLPPHADVHALEEAIFDAAMRACLSFDPETFISWPALLKAKIVMAPTEAARVDSKISRRHAKYAAAFRVAEEARVQELARPLTPQERKELAEEIAPDTRRERWSTVVQQNIRVVQIEALTAEGYSPQTLTSNDDAVEQALSSELRDELGHVLTGLPDSVRSLFMEELERVAEGKEPRKAVVAKLKRQLPQHLRVYLT